MKAVTEQDIRMSFINCSKGEAKRLPLPRDFEELPWEDLDFLGWRDLSAPGRSYIVTEHDGRLVGITLRFPSQQRGFLHRSMCSLCLTTHAGSGVSLMTARKAGPAGREGNSVGLYMCTDLACSLYVRGKKAVPSGARFKESLTMEEQIARTTANLSGFVAKLFG
ncbi:FBP domain-containing protein [Streptomyces laculatispora]|uniref:FBP domain-containing protein n=1 Tax=Streptomyces laculatispora TaxID=887464 RepID=A0ABY9HX66_9ACTN|nr:FBP domain-containing protein [Streptomyces laculatispora]WLQ39173.1 FBP domain-containing protein [Streptomyces laculatispora]